MESALVQPWGETAPEGEGLRAWAGKPGRIHTLSELAARLRAEFEGRDVVCPQRLQALMAAYQPASPRDWKPFAKFDRYRYTRNLVDEGDGRYNLMLLCWAEGHGSAIHDHAGAHCVMRILAGSLCEVRFAWPSEHAAALPPEEGEPLQELSKCTLENGDVCYINDSQGLHRVENPSHSERAVSLHLYCPPFGACGVFNQRTGHRSTSHVTFWSRPGDSAGGRVSRRNRPQAPAEDN
ncbi:hypothetical protein R5R35_014748 [Gryllus longicercus]|uniref:Cysteine dioxygenase n=1 Tax=Gryllus longicercus TaxID=2509291 RepID=A0AAN9YVE3_9ORTH